MTIEELKDEIDDLRRRVDALQSKLPNKVLFESKPSGELYELSVNDTDRISVSAVFTAIGQKRGR